MSTKHRPRHIGSSQSHRLWQEGVAHAKAKRWNEAVQVFEKARRIHPNDDVVLINLARAYLAVDRHEDAVVCARNARGAVGDSELITLLEVRGLLSLQRFAEARSCMELLPESMRTTHDYWLNYGLVLKGQGELKLAIDAFMHALSVKMDDAKTHYNLGICLYDMGLKAEACECYRTGLLLGLEEHTLHALGMLTFAERESCQWAEAGLHMTQLNELVAKLPTHVALMATMFAHITLSGDPLHQLKVAKLMSNIWRRVQPVKRNTRVESGRRVRVGYVSADFHNHATCVLMAEVFEHHDREKFEVFAYSHGPDDGSIMRQRVIHAIEHFKDVRGLGDTEIAKQIADDGIDVLIDLKGHTSQNRLGIFAYKPAPVQATFLGFPGTTGMDCMDYIIGDPIVTPLEHASHFAEKIAQLPICYQPNDRKRPMPRPMTRKDAGLPEDALVLCGFNQPFKISSEVLDVWCDLLKEIPDSILWLLEWHSQARPNLEIEFERRGVSLSRLKWAPKLDLADHLSRLSLADIFIDTWPCNAHTTASDALWAGVPVVTFRGETFASRVASSLLHAVGLDELICESVDVYKDTIKALVHHPSRRASLRKNLVLARDVAPLFDSDRFTRDYERLILRMHSEYIRGMPVVCLSALSVDNFQ